MIPNLDSGETGEDLRTADALTIGWAHSQDKGYTQTYTHSLRGVCLSLTIKEKKIKE